MTVLLLLALAATQDTIVISPPGRYGSGPAERRAVAVFNAPGTMRVLGGHTIGRDVEVAGSVAVLDGPLRVEGRVTGDLVAINADVEIVAGAEVAGAVLILGGRAEVSEDARVGGTLEQHTSKVRVRLVDQRLEIDDRDDPVVIIGPRHDGRLPRTYPAGRASFVFSTEGTYNRVEGLPLVIGPRVTWRSKALDARLEALGVFRTAAGFDLESREVGYRASGRFRFGGHERPLELSLRAFDQVFPIEDWQLHDNEVGWSSLLFHKDYRDYFLASGVGAGARIRIADPLVVFGEVTRLDATSIGARDPWSVGRNSQPWRLNPTIDEGRFTEYRAGVDLSTLRSWSRRGGVRLQLEWLHGVGENVTPRVLPPTVRDSIPLTGYSYDRLWADLRLHLPLAGGGLSLRGVAAGDLGENDPLPVHRRLSLGGPDPLPGFDFRRFSCNEGVGDPALPALCDRMVLAQLEFRTGFSFDTQGSDDEDRWWGDWGWDWDWFDLDELHLVLFSDAGAAWNGDNMPSRLNWDVGAGIEIGKFGLYFARALEEDRPVRAVLRLHHRF